MFVHCRADRCSCSPRSTWHHSNEHLCLRQEDSSHWILRRRSCSRVESIRFIVHGVCTTGVITHVPPRNFQKLVRSGGNFISTSNIHVKDHGNSDAILLADRLATFDGGAFDLIITGSDVAIESVEVEYLAYLASSQTTVWCPVVYSYNRYAAKQSKVQISLPEASGEWTDRLSSKQSGTVISAVLLHLRTQTICS